MDKIEKFLVSKGKIDVVVASTTDLVEESRKIHDLSPTAAAALGRTLTMGVLMGSTLKSKEDTITIQIKGNGPIGGITVVVNQELEVKGYVYEPKVDIPVREDGKLDVGRAVGQEGFLYVIKDLGLKEPYVALSKLVTGEIAEDFANYFLISEQKNTAVALGVLVNKDGVKSSGGYMITAMPDATEEDISKIEEALKKAKPISQMLDEEKSLLEIVKEITGAEEADIQKLEERKPVYHCNCSKEKMERALVAIGKEELENIIQTDKKAEMRCQFCNKTYHFSEEELKKLQKEETKERN